MTFNVVEGGGGGTKEFPMYRTNTVHSNIGGGTSHPNKVDMCDKLDLVVQSHTWIVEYRGTLCLELILTENLVVDEIVSYGGMFFVQINNNLYLFKYKYLSIVWTQNG